MDSGSVSAPAIGGIVALIISYIAVKSINRSNLWSKLFNDKDLTKGELDKPQKQSVELKKNIDMDKNTKFVISKGWLRIHIVLSLLATAGVFIAELDAYGDFGVTLAVFITYWLVVGCVVWIIKGFKESGKN